MTDPGRAGGAAFPAWPSARPADVHDLSVPGGRPLCGADAVAVAEHRGRDSAVSCPSCVRLLGEEARRSAHAAGAHAEESED